jgi:hypothetical protein
VGLLEEALTLDVRDQRRRAWLLCCAGAAHYYSDEENDERYAHEALALGRASEDPEVLLASLFAYHRWLTHDPTAVEQRLAMSREMCAVAERHQLQMLIGRAYRTLLVDLLGIGALQDFEVEHERFAELATRHGAPSDLYWVSALRATRALASDPEGDTEELIQAAHVLGRQLEQGDSEGTYILQLFALRYQQGRSREITASLQTPRPEHPRILAGLSILAAALVASGRLDDARAILDRVIRDGAIVLPHDNLWHAATALFGGVAAAAGTAEQRAVITQALAPLADLWCVFGAGGAVFGTTHHWLARLAVADGDRDRAVEHLRTAAGTTGAAGAPYWARVAQNELRALTVTT